MGSDELTDERRFAGSRLSTRPTSSERIAGVFPALVDRAAFVDRVALTIRGEKRDLLEEEGVRNLTNQPIGGGSSLYARVQRGVLVATGNSFDLKYGRMRLQKNIPALVLVLRSDRTPVSVQNIVAATNFLCAKGWTASVSQIEVTFDLTGLSVPFFERSILSSARRFRTLRDRDGRRTLYVGARTSPWQVRVYDKTAELVRFEFIARRAFLRAHRLQTPAHLGLFRDIDLRSRFRLCELHGCKMKSLLKSIEEDFRRRALDRWARNLPLRVFLPAAKKYFAAVPEELVVPSPVEERLRRMQWKLSWGR
jgi:hypothetical protein